MPGRGELFEPFPIQPTSSIFLSSSGFAQLQMVQKVLLFQA
jgi:hypothetical protein